MTLIHPPETDAEGNTRTFSIASPPFENELVFTTRMRDTAFKRSLQKVPLATEVKIGSAAGSFTLHKNRGKPAVFLAGGIGITPFLSIVRQAHHDRLPHNLYLFYSNRRPEDAPFLETLQNLEKTNPNFHLICTMTEMSKSKKEWKGEVVVIDQDMLSRHLATLRGPIYYSAGPPAITNVPPAGPTVAETCGPIERVPPPQARTKRMSNVVFGMRRWCRRLPFGALKP